jgi:GntR family transcriptional regulator/MocR family aminotransferase
MSRALKLVLKPSGLPLFQQIAEAVIEAIRQGRISRGAKLPGTRALATQLDVHRSTVVAAFKELEDQGWLRSSPASGTFVSSATPALKAAKGQRRAETPGFDFIEVPVDEHEVGREPGVLHFSGAPDVRVMPIDLMARAYRRALTRRRASPPEPLGHEPLRTAVASMLRQERGLDVTTEQVMIVPRGTVAVELVMRALVTAGDTVALEELGHRPLREILERQQVRLAPLAIDEQGLRVDALEALTLSQRVRAVWVTPQCQYPTNVVMSDARRRALLELAQKQRLAVVESDYLHDFHYGDENHLPLVTDDHTSQVIYLGSLARVLAPDVQLGYVVAAPAFLRVLAQLRQRADRHDEFATQLAVAELMEDGEYQRALRRSRQVYLRRRDLLAQALRQRLGDVLTFDLPGSGTALWTRVTPRIDVEHWAVRARERKVQFRTALHFAHDRNSRPFIRLGFTQLDEKELVTAVDRLAQALR